MILNPVAGLPRNPGEWCTVRVDGQPIPSGLILACPGCGVPIHLGPAPHPSNHEIEWMDSYKRFSITAPILCGITKGGTLCDWVGTVEDGVVKPA
jgi:hypothetical protein